jgi:hypothetical protein
VKPVLCWFAAAVLLWAGSVALLVQRDSLCVAAFYFAAFAGREALAQDVTP